MPRTLVIGDVHGCADELSDLLQATGARDEDRIVLVGDLVAKGPLSRRVVQMARERKMLAVRGNHDAAVLRYRRAVTAGQPPPRLKPTHKHVAETLAEADWQYLEALPDWLELPELSVLVVHAGIVPGKPLTEQRSEDLLTMRSLRPDGTASSKLDDGEPWARHYRGPMHVVFGHDAISGLQRYPFATGLDTGCVYGRSLSALILPSHELFSVPARRAYVELDA
jgi:predicted phosphodiesterase